MARADDIPRDGEVFTLAPVAPISPGDEVLGDIDDDLRADLRSILADFGDSPDDAKIQIKFYRMKENGSLAHLFDVFDANTDYMNRIKREYGSGDYVGHIYLNGTLKKKKRFAVELPKSPAPDNNAGVIEYLAASQERAYSQMRELIREMREPQKSAQSGAMESLEIIKAAREAFGGNSGGANWVDSLVKVSPLLLPFITAMAEKLIAKGGDNPMSALEQALSMAEKLKGLTGDGGESGGMLGMIKEMAPGFIDVLKTARQQEVQNLGQATTVPQTPQTHTPRPMAAPEPVPAPFRQAPMEPSPVSREVAPAVAIDGAEATDMNLQIKFALNMLCGKAAKGEDVKDVAPALLGMVSDDQIDKFMDLIEAPDAVEQLIVMHGPVGQHREWFENLRAALLAEFDSGDEPGENRAHGNDGTTHGDTGRPSGDAGDAKGDGDSGEAGQD